jgi:uncharacterized protein
MAFQAIPRELIFYDLLEQQAEIAHRGASALTALLGDLPHGGQDAERIRQMEHEGDELTHRVMETLNTTFVTPFDRKDIHTLASALDDILDAQEAVSDLLVLHRVVTPPPFVVQQAEILERITAGVVAAVHDLRTLTGVERDWAQVNRLEREGDRVYRRAVAELFSGDHEPIEVLKWKDIVDQLEDAIDRCQHISNTIESIALKLA